MMILLNFIWKQQKKKINVKPKNVENAQKA